MKVYIGPYKKWWGPYQLAQLIPFTNEDQQDNIGEWLSKTWLSKVCDWFYKLRGERTVKVRIDKYDTWSMDHTLAYIILPMLKQLRDTKHGSPIVDDEDVPPHMRYSDPQGGEWGPDNWVHYKWEWILNEIIFAFESEFDDWEEQFYHGTPEYEEKEEEVENYGACYSYKQTNPDYWVDYEGIKMYNERIQNGFRLFGKYYQNLWD